MKEKKTAGPTFEKALERLEAIVEKLESEELGLDASLALFEEGMKLSRTCQARLDGVERRVEIVLKEEGGTIATAPFPADEEEGAEADVDGEEEGGE
jgi:exodeoxyribonuclease VII small subunit